MISTKFIYRFFHLQRECFAIEKSSLAILRKKTGYTFANCKKALERHNNDLNKAELWLKEQAQVLGWAKATKLEGRHTSQGLVAVAVNGYNGALVEVNCETDFVARNTEFIKIVQEAAQSCLNYTKQQVQPVVKLNSEDLKSLPASNGKLLGDHLALMIGHVGENASLRRALSLKVPKDIYLAGYAHPVSSEDTIQQGKICGLVALKKLGSNEVDLNSLGRDLCKHIVGMNPKKIGTENDQAATDKDNEVCLIHQDYLLDDTVTVGCILEENQVAVVDFQRFECGEEVNPTVEQPLELIETCQ